MNKKTAKDLRSTHIHMFGKKIIATGKNRTAHKRKGTNLKAKIQEECRNEWRSPELYME